VISGLYPGVTTVELDNLAAEIAATMTTYHPDYATLAARYVPPTYQCSGDIVRRIRILRSVHRSTDQDPAYYIRYGTVVTFTSVFKDNNTLKSHS